MILLQFILFIFLFYIFIYTPGRVILRFAHLSYSPAIRILLSIVVGMVSFLLLAYLFAWVHLDFLAFIAMGSLTIFDRGQSLKELFAERKKLLTHKAEVVLLFIGIIGMCYLTWRSGVVRNGQYVFYGINSVDSLYHLALIGNLTHNFPPEHFGLSGVPLRGYHFFYDFLIALFAKYFHFQVIDLYLRFFPVITSFLFGLSFIGLSNFLKWRRSTTLGIIFSIFFFCNFEFFFNFFSHSELLVHIPEGVTQILDPSVPLSLAIFISSYILFQSNNKLPRQMLVAALVIGVLPMFKIYTGMLFFVGFSTLLLWSFYKRNYHQYLFTFISAVLVAAVVYLPINFGAGGFVFAPFIYLRHLMEGSIVFQTLHWPEQYQIFQDHHNYPHIGFLLAVIGGIFLLETLGWRVPVGIMYLFQYRKKTFTIDGNILFWSVVFLTGLLIPIFFIQSSSVFNIIQFYWIVLALSTPFFVMQFDAVTVNWSRVTRKMMWGLIIITSIPSLFFLYTEYSVNPTYVDPDTTLTTRNIAEFVPADKMILVLGKKDNTSIPLISALTSHSIYLENEGIDFAALQNEIYDRQVKLDRILVLAQDCNTPDKLIEMKKLISLTHAKYIYAISSYSCLQNKSNFNYLGGGTGAQQVFEIL